MVEGLKTMSVPQNAAGVVNFSRKRLTPSEDLPCNKREKKKSIGTSGVHCRLDPRVIWRMD